MADDGRTSGAVVARWQWPLAVVAVAIIVLIGVARACRTVEKGQQQASESVVQIADTATGLAEAFKTGTITTTFIAAIPHLAAGEGTKLELVAFEATETFSREDDRRVLFDLVHLGTTITEIRVPVTYRYHLRLDEPWQLEVRDHSCVVRAPRIRPTLPPAIHTDGLEKRIDSGWLRFDDSEQMDELERTITQRVSARAGDPDHIGLIRDRCRLRVADFVRNWLLVEEHWREDRFSSVIVIFADEESGEDQALPQPSLSLETDLD